MENTCANEQPEGGIRFLPVIDSRDIAAARQKELDISRDQARALGVSAVDICRKGWYLSESGKRVDWKKLIGHAVSCKISIPPKMQLPGVNRRTFPTTLVSVTNETTLTAALLLTRAGHPPLALNFANGTHPGGGFLTGSRAQEEFLCRSSALHATLDCDPMYDAHRQGIPAESSDWVILSPDVPVFRNADGFNLDAPWLLSMITCAAPYAPAVGQKRSGDLLEARIRRVLAVACAYGYDTLLLGAWGCGAFANDPSRTARSFRSALENEFRGQLREVLFAITDWSAERRYLAPFVDVFSDARSAANDPVNLKCDLS